MTVLNLANLPTPQVVEELDFESIYQSALAELSTITGDNWSAALESDPAVKLLEEWGYREMGLRARINDAARAVMLPYAVGGDLDQIASRFGVSRLLVSAGDSAAIPPTADVWESDDRLRLRTQLALESFSVAGSRGMYLYHALTASSRVLEANIAGSELAWDTGIPVSLNGIPPGVVRIYLLSTDNANIPDSDLLNTVSGYLSDETRRPLTDSPEVLPAEILTYTLSATLIIYPGPLPGDVQAAALAAVQAATDALFKIGYDHSRSALVAALSVPGVQAVTLASPSGDVAVNYGQVARCTAFTVTVGGVNV